MALSAPTLLAEQHDLSGFCCGQSVLDNWLRNRALANQASGASRTYVVCEGSKVAGYYALASGSVSQGEMPGRFRRNMADPIPVVLLGRLAIDLLWQGQGVGRALFGDAAARVSQAADVIGIRGMVVHALSDDARKFYLSLGFFESRNPMVLSMTIQEIRADLR